jgi:hypothetical protein
LKQLFYLLVFLFAGCAQQTALTGGNKDVLAPELIVNKTSPKPNTTNFDGKDIKLVFNENIIYQKSAISFISNPTVGQQEITIDKNILTIKPEYSLKENTTYTFMFANSIADLNEKNNIEDLRFSFSTGSILDSINVNGFVKNSIDQIPNVDFLVSLESTKEDSLQYLSLSKSNGEYSFTNLKPGKYVLSAWEDLNKNNKLDTIEEPHGFLSTAVQIEDSCCKEIINTYIPLKPLLIDKVNLNEYGELSLLFNQPIDTLLIRNLDSAVFNSIIVNNAEANFWISDTNATNYRLIINVPAQNFRDTIVVRKAINQDEKSKLNYQKKSIKNLFSSKNLHLIFNQELISIDTSFIILKRDSLKTNYQYIITNNELIISPELPTGSFNITAFPNGFTGFYHSKTDTTKIYFSTEASSSLGILTLDVHNTLSKNYVVQLLSNNEIIHELYSSTHHFNKTMERVVPGEYELRLIIDNDANKKWSPGDIKTNTQPEKVIYLDKKIVVQKNWEEFIKWDL